MSFEMQCPFCATQVKLPETANLATCPKCSKTFRAVRPEEAEAIAAHQGAHSHAAASGSYDSDDDTEADSDVPSAGEGLLPSWISLWGFVAFLLGGVAFLLAALAGVRWLTIVFSILGLVTVVVGMALTAKNHRAKDISWLIIGGLFCVAILGLTLIAPGMLNRYWEMDSAVPVPDPHKLVAVPRNEQRSEGRSLAPADWADGVTELIRQDDAQIRINAVALGPLADKPGKTFLLVNVRLANTANEIVTFEGFGKAKHQPVLKDGSGKSYAFLEQRRRKPAAGAVVYIAAEPETINLGRTRFFDMQLVFEAPPADFSALKLELPASAYGRRGVCKFTISNLFVAPLPEVKPK